MQTMGQGEAWSDSKPLTNDSFKWSLCDSFHWVLLLSISATIFILSISNQWVAISNQPLK